MVNKRKFSDEQIIKVMKEIEGGVPVKEACRQNGINDRTDLAPSFGPHEITIRK